MSKNLIDLHFQPQEPILILKAFSQSLRPSLGVKTRSSSIINVDVITPPKRASSKVEYSGILFTEFVHREIKSGSARIHGVII